MQTESASRELKISLNEYLKKAGLTKRELAYGISVGPQSITDWTKGSPKPVTAENAVRLAVFANDSTLARSISHEYLGLPPSMQGSKYQQELAALNSLREVEEMERDRLQDSEMIRTLCQQSELSDGQKEDLLKLAEQVLIVCVVNEQYLTAICERLGISTMDLTKLKEKDLEKRGYFRGEKE